jgi:MFS family permease
MNQAAAEFRRGWSVILAAAVGVGLGVTGLPIYTTGQFILPLQTAFGWNRAEISSGLLCLTVVGVVMAPIIGLLTERFGVRRVAITAMLGLAVGYTGCTTPIGPCWPSSAPARLPLSGPAPWLAGSTASVVSRSA